MPDTSNAHRIRLHGPWEFQMIDLGGDEPMPIGAVSRVKVPGKIQPIGTIQPIGKIQPINAGLGSPATTKVVLTRAFNLPTGLTDEQSVFLFIESISHRSCIFLNRDEENIHGKLGWLSARSEMRFDITGLLTNRNQLEIEIETGSGQDFMRSIEISGEVRLEIVG